MSIPQVGLLGACWSVDYSSVLIRGPNGRPLCAPPRRREAPTSPQAGTWLLFSLLQTLKGPSPGGEACDDAWNWEASWGWGPPAVVQDKGQHLGRRRLRVEANQPGHLTSAWSQPGSLTPGWEKSRSLVPGGLPASSVNSWAQCTQWSQQGCP